VNPRDARFCRGRGVVVAAESGEPHRKTVTVLFCDLAGSTELGESVDAERLRGLLSAYFERIQGIAERHGGQIEKFIGDAVVAVFGIPVLHEDDALRALRAAVEMRAALPELGLAGRIGVMTGEVVTASPQAVATGDALNVAARLQQAAAPGEVLVGEPTTELAGDAAVLEAVEPLALKGKARPVSAFRLLEVREPSPRQHFSGFVVGSASFVCFGRSGSGCRPNDGASS
jgi:class 3 adenylate cyclase